MTNDDFKEFDWGQLNLFDLEIIKKEIFEDKIYEKHGTVKKNDIVVDIGANCGAFTYSIINKLPNHVYCVEPSNVLIPTLQKNVGSENVTIVKKAITSLDGVQSYVPFNTQNTNQVFSITNHTDSHYDSISFKHFIEEYGIQKIDFLKFDCEGGEIHIFNPENVDFITKNVSLAVGEWHFINENFVTAFITFRNLYLKNIKSIKVYQRDERDISKEIFDDTFVIDFEKWWRGTGLAQFLMYIEFN